MSNDTDAPNVDTFVVFVLTDDLWSHVQWAAKHLLELLLRVIETSEPKVSQLDVWVILVCTLLWGDEDVLWLDVSVSDVLLVHVVDGQQDLLQNVGCLSLCESLHFQDVVIELTSGHNL